MDIGTLVRGARERASLTQRQLAERAGTTQAVVARIESGGTNPTVETVERLIDAAGFVLTVGMAPKSKPDPVTEAYRSGIDVTLLRENLRKTPEARVEAAIGVSKLAEEFRRAGARARKAER
jgi:transcriptional regulator with XRE-family HTH domain